MYTDHMLVSLKNEDSRFGRLGGHAPSDSRYIHLTIEATKTWDCRPLPEEKGWWVYCNFQFVQFCYVFFSRHAQSAFSWCRQRIGDPFSASCSTGGLGMTLRAGGHVTGTMMPLALLVLSLLLNALSVSYWPETSGGFVFLSAGLLLYLVLLG